MIVRIVIVSLVTAVVVIVNDKTPQGTEYWLL